MTTTLLTEPVSNINHDLPPGWAWTTLGAISETITKGSTPTSYGFTYKTEGINFIKTENITSSGYIEHVTDYIDENTNLYLKRSILQEGDLLFSIAGTIGRVGRIRQINLPANTNQALAIIRGLQALVDNDYLFYFLQSPAIQQLALKSVVGVGRANLSLTSLAEISFPLPPLAEQRRIVAAIEEQSTQLDAGVAALKRAQANLGRYRASVLKAACEGVLVPQDSSDEPATVLLDRILAERRARWEAEQIAKMEAQGKTPLLDTWKAKYAAPAPPNTDGLSELPAGWTWATVEQLAANEPRSITDGPFGSNLKTEHYTSAGPRVIRLQNIGDGKFVDEQAHISADHFATLRKHEVFANDLVIAALGESLPRACIIPESVGQAIVKADCIRFKPHSTFVAERYLNAALNSEIVKKAAQRIVHGIGRPRLNQQEIKSLPIPLPPLAEQQRIVAEVERRLSVVDEMDAVLAANLKRAERLRQAILRQAFAGKLVPQDPQDEPASVVLERIRAERKASASKQNGKPRRHQKSEQLTFLEE